MRYALEREHEVDRTGAVSEEEGTLDQQGTRAEDVGTIVVDCMCVRPNDLRQLLKATPSDQLADLIADFFESAASSDDGGRDSPTSLSADVQPMSSTEQTERRLVKFFAPFATEPVPCPAQEAREMRIAAQQRTGASGSGFFAPVTADSGAAGLGAAGAAATGGAARTAALAIAPPPIGAAASELSRQLSEDASALFAGFTSRLRTGVGLGGAGPESGRSQ